MEELEHAVQTMQPELRYVTVSVGMSMTNLDPKRLVAALVGMAPRSADPAAAAETAVSNLEREFEDGIACEFFTGVHGIQLSDAAVVHFPGGLLLRAVDERDVDRLSRESVWVPNAVMVANFTSHPVATGAEPRPTMPPAQDFRAAAAAAARAMMLAKNCTMQLGMLWHSSRSHLSIGGFGTGEHVVVPLQPATLTGDDIAAVEALALRLAAGTHPMLQLAIERLAEAQLRNNPRDSILDAITALEPLLIPEGPREGLRFRVSHHYAALAPLGERDLRLSRYREMYDLYRVRSEIAHAGRVEGEYTVAGQKLKPHEVAEQSRAALRDTVLRLLDVNIPTDGKSNAAYWREFWERRVFGLDPP